MAKVSSAPADAQKSAQYEKLMLHPASILQTNSNRSARPGPPPPDEEKAIAGLARDMLAIGQIVPVIVGPPDGAGFYPLIDGARRVQAAHLIECEKPGSFPLWCVIGTAQTPAEAQQHAIHANIKRRGLTALQLAHLFANLRKEHSWTGTKELSEYLGVSRALISEHDKLLHKPDGMPQEVYDELLAIVQEGRIGAGTAFYTLTHVEPVKAAEVLEKAQKLAEAEEAVKEEKRATRTQKSSASAPAAPNARESASQKQTKPVSTPKKPVKVEKKHVQRAARESGAVRSSVQRTLPELRMLFAKLAAPEWPDRLRNFASLMADAWWNGRATDAEVIAKWKELAAGFKVHERDSEATHNRARRTRVKLPGRVSQHRAAAARARKRTKRAA